MGPENGGLDRQGGRYSDVVVSSGLTVLDTSEYLLSFVVFQNMNLVVVILDILFKTGKSGTQWYCVIPVTFSVP